MANIVIFSEERCIMCGAIIPEGQQVCPRCVENVTSLRSAYIAKSSQAALPEVPISDGYGFT